MMTSQASKGRTHKTLGRNDRLLRSEQSLRKADTDPQGLLTIDAVRRHIIAQTCPYCGAGPFKSLASHTNKAHGIDRKELRERGGFLVSESIAAPEYSEACRQRAVENDQAAAIVKHSRDTAGVKRGPRPLNDIAKQKIADTVRATNDRLSPEQRSERMKAIAAANPAGSAARQRQGKSLRQWHIENADISAAMVSAMQAGYATPETQEKLAAVAERRRFPHGTAARYSHGGCRCDPCRDAKRASRPGPGIRSGETHPAAKLTDAQRASVPLLVGKGQSQKSVADELGVSQGTISRIMRESRDPKG
jgi:hypothetical protein